MGANINLARNWRPIIDKVSDKLSLWKAKTLSLGGWVTLCKSVLGSLPLYFLSLFKAPNKVIDSIEPVRRKFICGVTRSGEKQNQLRELEKNYCTQKLNEDNALWVNIIKSFHGITGRDPNSIASSKKSGVWLNIVRLGEVIHDLSLNIEELFIRSVGKGDNTFF